jgi:choline-sulfatase
MNNTRQEKSETQRISRRRFMETASLAALGTTVGAVSRPVWAKTPERPNILLIISDEHRAAVTGCYGNSLVLTPHLDELASRGVLFENCYTNSPLCVPSRLSMTSGKYCSRVGAWSNTCWLPSNDYPSIARVVQAQGYEAFLAGKMHYDPTRNYGFNEISRFWTNEVTKTGRGKRRPPDDTEINYANWWKRSSEFHAGQTSTTLDHDPKVRDLACQFLAERKSTEKPFLLVVGFLAPHFPLIVPEEFHAAYRGRVEPPRLPPGHVKMQPLNYQQLRHGLGYVHTDPQVVAKGRELYCGLTQWCDHNIGRVLEALRKSSVARNTVVIYTSDHGENMGEHAMWWKNCMYQTATQVPLIISWPERWLQGRRFGACSLLDMVQTVVHLAGADPPGDWNGDFMVPWLDDRQHPWKDLAVSEYYGHAISSGYVMLRHGKYKYVYHTRPTPDFPNQRELYDLETDPDEFVNLVSIPEQQDGMAQFHAMMLKEIGEDPEETEQRCRANYAAGYNRQG